MVGREWRARGHQLAGLAVVGVCLWGACLPVRAAYGPEETITSIDGRMLLSSVGISSESVLRCDDVGLHYCYLTLQAEGTRDFGVGVFGSSSDADKAYKGYLQKRAQEQIETLRGIGDRAAWVRGESIEQSVILRRVNAVVVVVWQGEKEKGVEFARKVDEVLTQRTDICPRGASVEHPAVELIAPSVMTAGTKVGVKYRGLKAMLIRTEVNPSLHLEGATEVDAGEAGRKTFQFTFYSEKCVVFDVPLTVSVVPAGTMPSATTTQAWDSGGDTLYFLEQERDKWEAAPVEKREMITSAQPHLVAVRDADNWRQKALNDLAEIVQPQWLPLPSMVQVFENHARPDGGIVYNARFETRGCNILYMGTLGRRLFAYVEQPDPLPKGQAPLKPQDLLRPDVTDKISDVDGEEVFPRVSCLTRDLRRFRAFKSEGPYEPVNVLLLRAKFPSELNLKFPGYR